MFKIYKINNHDEAYQIWNNHSINNAVLFHIDAHKDFVTEKCNYISIGNFLSYAWNDGIINNIVWIIPDPSFLCNNILDKLIEELENDFTLVAICNKMVKFVMNTNTNNELIITMISNVSQIMESMNFYENVLVDIDIDYFINPYIDSTYSNYHLDSFWIKSNKVCDAIRPLIDKCEIITIARSIYGGYTPLIYSFICDQIHDILISDNTCIQGYIYIEKAIDLLKIHNNVEASELFERSLYYPNCYLSSNIGLIYSYILSDRGDKAKKYYDNLLTKHPTYEPYFFPVHSMVKENRIAQAENIIDSWLKISPHSHQANLYKIKVLSSLPICHETEYNMYLNKINDKETYFEKSYVMVDYYLKLHRYDEAIECCEKVLDYLKNNDSPLWVGQISTYERRKNHGNAIAFLFEKMASAHFNKNNLKSAHKYASMCKKIGYESQNIEYILRIVLKNKNESIT